MRLILSELQKLNVSISEDMTVASAEIIESKDNTDGLDNNNEEEELEYYNDTVDVIIYT